MKKKGFVYQKPLLIPMNVQKAQGICSSGSTAVVTGCSTGGNAIGGGNPTNPCSQGWGPFACGSGNGV